MKRTVVFYRTFSGCPFEIFLDSLPGQSVKKITWVLSVVEELDCAVEMLFGKDAREGIRECRIACGDAVFRVLVFLYGREMVVLWGGILVKFQDILREQLEQALRYKNDFLQKRRKH